MKSLNRPHRDPQPLEAADFASKGGNPWWNPSTPFGSPLKSTSAIIKLRHAKKYEPTRCAVMRVAPSSRQLVDMSFGHATEAESNDGDRAQYE